jgi:negative regulator of flagellin synthesis FlgM
MSEINNIRTAGQNGVNAPRNVNARENRDANAAKSPGVNAGAADQVSLTNTATQLQAVQQTLSEVPEVNSDKVAALKAAIADGSYEVDANKLAQNLIEFEQQF